MPAPRQGKITAIGILRWNGDDAPVYLGMAFDVNEFGFFQRGQERDDRGREDASNRSCEEFAHFFLLHMDFLTEDSVRKAFLERSWLLALRRVPMRMASVPPCAAHQCTHPDLQAR